MKWKRMIYLAVSFYIVVLLAMPYALAVNYNLSGSDPSGDVRNGYTEVGGYSYIDITHLESRDSGGDIILELRCADDIVYEDDVTYGIHVLFQFEDVSNLWGIGVGYCSVQQNVFYWHEDASYSRIDSATFTRVGRELTVRFPKSELSSVPAWHLYATCTDLSEGVQDIAQVEGNAFGFDILQYWWLILFILIAVIVVAVSVKMSKTTPKDEQPSSYRQPDTYRQGNMGGPLPPPPPEITIEPQNMGSCLQCGERLEEGWAKCPYCLAPVDSEEEVLPPPPKAEIENKPPVVTTDKGDITSRLTKLKELRNQELISDEDFEVKKSKLLEEI